MITGVVGAIISYCSYKKAKNIKSLDLRVERRKLLNNAHAEAKQAIKLQAEAVNSRNAAASAAGSFNSGRHKEFIEDLENQKETIENLKSLLSDYLLDIKTNDERKLEKDVNKIHEVSTDLKVHIKELEKSLEEDDLTRSRLHAEKFNTRR